MELALGYGIVACSSVVKLPFTISDALSAVVLVRTG